MAHKKAGQIDVAGGDRPISIIYFFDQNLYFMNSEIFSVHFFDHYNQNKTTLKTLSYLYMMRQRRCRR